MPRWTSHLVCKLCLFAAALPISISSVTAQETSSLEGFSRPIRISEVASATNGIVQRQLVPLGAHVSAGDCIVELDASVHTERLRVAEVTSNARGELQLAESELAHYRRRVEILEHLAKNEHASVEELLRAQSDEKKAAANLKIATEQIEIRKAEYAQLVAEARNFCIRAPFDGVVTKFAKEKGESVGQLEPHVCTIADLSKLSVEFLLPRSARASIDVGQTVDIRFATSNQSASGQVYFVSPYPDAETNTYSLRVEVENGELALDAGERCQLLLDGVATEEPAVTQFTATK